MQRLEVRVVAELGLGKTSGTTLSQEMKGVIAIAELHVDQSSEE